MRGAFITGCHRVGALLALCLLFCLPVVPAHAAMVDLTPCVASVRSGDSAASVLAEAKRFDCISPQSSLQAGDYWVRIDVPLSAHQPGQRPVLRFASVWEDGLALTAIHADGSVRYYNEAEIAERAYMRLGATRAIMLDGQRPAVETLLAKVSGSVIVRGVLQAPQLSTPNEAINYELAMASLYAGFGGLAIAMLVYSIALWRAMREKFLLAYCAMVAAMTVYAFFTSGAVHYVIDGLSGGDRLRITIPLLAISASTALIFIHHFFEASNIPRWLLQVTISHATAMSAFALFYGAVAPNYVATLDQIYLLGFVPVPFIFSAYLWFAWRKKDPFLRYFIVAWSGPAVCVAVRMAHGYGLLPYHILIENSTLIGLAFEALVSSLAIGHRVRLLAQARDRAETAAASALVMADTDPLTGLLNRRAFLRKILDRPNHWTLLLLDVDHFKRVNDSLGHAGGDDAIISIAAVLRSNAPEGAFVARMGGEEFAICCHSMNNAALDPDKLLSDVRSMKLPEGYRVTASVGIANWSVHNENDWKILYRAADMALYRAKSGGRDCYIRHDTERAAA